MIYDFLSMLDYGSCSHLLTSMWMWRLNIIYVLDVADLENTELKYSNLNTYKITFDTAE